MFLKANRITVSELDNKKHFINVFFLMQKVDKYFKNVVSYSFTQNLSLMHNH